MPDLFTRLAEALRRPTTPAARARTEAELDAALEAMVSLGHGFVFPFRPGRRP